MTSHVGGVAALFLCFGAAAAQAQTAPSPRDADPGVATAEVRSNGAPEARATLDAEQLDGLTARQGAPSTTTVLSDQDLTAINQGNSITAVTVGSGPISIGANAFQGFAGVGNFVINSGHNNNLQSALTIVIVAP